MPSDLPASKLRTKLEKLPEVARAHAFQELAKFHFTTLDLASLDVDEEGGIFYIDHFSLDTNNVSGGAGLITGAAALPVNPFPPSLVFHSKPGSPNVLFLNFAGEMVSNTAWNTSLSETTIPAVAFSTDSDFSTFSDAEQTAIKRIWERVSEDYAPFDIDVTTERPQTFGTRTAEAVITRSTDANGAANPSSAAGGVAYINCFATSSYSRYRPAWIYADNLSGIESYVAEAASHEIGHNMGLSHDGKTDGTEYYGGHGTGDTSWGPLMGTGYGRNVSQWSKGEYYLANNTEDDLAIIAGKAPYQTDDHGDTAQTASALVITGGTNIVSSTPETDPTNLNPANKGVLERSTDVDVFSFVTGAGMVKLTVNPWINPSGTRGGNLDVSIELRDANNNTLATNNSATTTGAQIQMAVAAGTYYLFIRNSAAGDPLNSTPTGYTSYGSIGQYFISGNIASPSGAAPTVQLTTSANNSAWGSVTPQSGNFTAGDAVQLAATPAPYYRFVSWENDVTGTNNPTLLVLQSNLTVTATFAEQVTTNYSTPYWWLAAYGYTNNFDAAANVVGANGMPLWQSYIAGLNPTDPANQLKLGIQKDRLTGTAILNWSTVSGRLYTVWWATNFTGPFTRLAAAINLPSTIHSVTNTSVPALPQVYYRLEVAKP